MRTSGATVAFVVGQAADDLLADRCDAHPPAGRESVQQAEPAARFGLGVVERDRLAAGPTTSTPSPRGLLDDAKALLVVGLHTDRRAVRTRARAHGTHVFYVDPEGLTENGEFRQYPIEGAREGDVIVREQATPALRRLCQHLGITSRHVTAA